MWFIAGSEYIHSLFVFLLFESWFDREDAILSHTIHIIIITDRNEMNEPKEETIFHGVKASGKSEYRRGIPFNPRKCWGKNVMLTPTNMQANWVFNSFGFMIVLKITGDQ